MVIVPDATPLSVGASLQLLPLLVDCSHLYLITPVSPFFKATCEVISAAVSEHTVWLAGCVVILNTSTFSIELGHSSTNSPPPKFPCKSLNFNCVNGLSEVIFTATSAICPDTDSNVPSDEIVVGYVGALQSYTIE